jgi:lysophospholipase L1-like esterase
MRITNPKAPTKRVTMSLGAPRTQNAAGALTNWAERIPIRVPRTTVRWRLRVGNHVLLPTAAPLALTQQFSIGDVYLGTPGALSTDGRPIGTWASTPTKVLDGALMPANGTDWVSPWVTDPALQFGPTTTRQLGITLSGTNNGNGSGTTSSHYGHRSTTAGINAINASQLNRNNFVGNTLALDKRVEYEFVADDLVGLLIGASGDEGYNLTVGLDGTGGFEVLPVHETWAGVHGLRNKVHWVNASIVGATQTPYLDRTALTYTRFDMTTTVPDFAVVSLGGNSVLSGAGVLATIKSEIATVVSQVRALGINRIYLATIVAVGLTAADAKEILRGQVNDWIRTNPLQVDGVADVDLILRDPANVHNQLAGMVTSDAIHPTHGGYQRWAMAIPNLH